MKACGPGWESVRTAERPTPDTMTCMFCLLALHAVNGHRVSTGRVYVTQW